MSQVRTISFFVAAIFLIASTCFYFLSLQPQVNYFNKLAKSIVILSAESEKTSTLCGVEKINEDLLFQASLAREEALTNAIVQLESNLSIPMPEKFKMIKEFFNQTMVENTYYFSHGVCSASQKSPAQIQSERDRSLLIIPLTFWQNIKFSFGVH